MNVQSEHVNATVLCIVALPATLGKLGTNHFADILYDHRMLLYITVAYRPNPWILERAEPALRVHELFGIQTRRYSRGVNLKSMSDSMAGKDSSTRTIAGSVRPNKSSPLKNCGKSRTIDSFLRISSMTLRICCQTP